jgi:ribonucleoside-diphosphate reductase alpha chain
MPVVTESTVPDVSAWTVIKRDGKTTQPFDANKIVKAICAAARGVVSRAPGGEATMTMKVESVSDGDLPTLVTAVVERLKGGQVDRPIPIETIQDAVERALIAANLPEIAKAYILYRADRAKLRAKAGEVSAEDEAAIAINRTYFQTDLQVFQALNKYARWLDDKGRRENWRETTQRAINFMKWQVKHHTHGRGLTDAEWGELEKGMLNLDVLPSLRLVQMAGPALERCRSGVYNCAFVAVDSLLAFSEILYVLMQGSGVGFSVESNFIEDLPKVRRQRAGAPLRHKVEDTTEGWCEALRIGVTSWFNGRDVKFDTSKVRPAGSRLKTKGGYASGPGPLVELLDFARTIILSRQCKRLRTRDVHDICCKIGKVVVVGGVRRAAMLSLSDLDDVLMRDCKQGQFWTHSPQRTMANDSAVYGDEKPDSVTFMREWLQLIESGTGERGIFNRGGLLRTFPARRTKVPNIGVNPCAEILLRSRQFCNLSISVVREADTAEDLARKVRLASMFGTIQSTMTQFRYLSKPWKKNCEEERLLGVDVAGVQDSPLLKFGAAGRAELLEKLKGDVIRTNQDYAARLGIAPSAAVTCNKPSGNSSVLLGIASGISPRWSPYYIRNVRVNSVEPMAQFLIDAGVPHYPEYDDPNPKSPRVWVFSFPVKSPEGAVFRKDMSAIDQLENWKTFKVHWTEHNPSVTIYVGEDEWFRVGAWVLDNWDIVGGLSFMTRDDTVYPLSPYQEITKKEYEKAMSTFPKIPWEKFARYERVDTTTIGHDLACTGGVCEIP